MAREFPDEVYAAIKYGVQRGEIAATIYRAITSEDTDTLAAYGLSAPVSISKRTVEQRAAKYKRELPAVEPTPAGEETATTEAVLRRALAYAQHRIKVLTQEPDSSSENALAVRNWAKTAADIGRYFSKPASDRPRSRQSAAGAEKGRTVDTPAGLARIMGAIERDQAKRAGQATPDPEPASGPQGLNTDGMETEQAGGIGADEVTDTDTDEQASSVSDTDAREHEPIDLTRLVPASTSHT